MYDVCSRPCEIYKDTVNNASGAQGPDGVEDTDTPISDCASAFPGPGGDTYTCVNFGQAGGQTLAYCLPGTSFAECDSDADCPADEGCQLTTVGGSINERCFSRMESGEWGEVVQMSEDCNGNPFEGDVTLCETGLCFGLGIPLGRLSGHLERRWRIEERPLKLLIGVLSPRNPVSVSHSPSPLEPLWLH